MAFPLTTIEAIGFLRWSGGWLQSTFSTHTRVVKVAWIFAQVLRCLCHLMEPTCISMYPYQLGHNNEEAIAGRGFLVLCKLGFRARRRTCCAWGRTVRRLESHKTAGYRTSVSRNNWRRSGGGAPSFLRVAKGTRGAPWERFFHAKHRICG